MPAGLYGRVSSSTSNTNASAQNGSTGRNGNSSGGTPNGAIRLRGTIGKYNGANTTEYDTVDVGTTANSVYQQQRIDQTWGSPTWTSGQNHPTHTFTVNSGIGATFTKNTDDGFTMRTYTDAIRDNVKLSDFYKGGARVPDTIGNYTTIPTSGEIRMSAFRNQAQLMKKADLKTAYSQLIFP